MDAFLRSFAPDSFSWESSTYYGSPWWRKSHQGSVCFSLLPVPCDDEVDWSSTQYFTSEADIVDDASGKVLEWTTSLFTVVVEESSTCYLSVTSCYGDSSSALADVTLSLTSKMPLELLDDWLPCVSLSKSLWCTTYTTNSEMPTSDEHDPPNPEAGTTARSICMWGRRLDRVPKVRVPGQSVAIYCFDPKRQNTKMMAKIEAKLREEADSQLPSTMAGKDKLPPTPLSQADSLAKSRHTPITDATATADSKQRIEKHQPGKVLPFSAVLENRPSVISTENHTTGSSPAAAVPRRAPPNSVVRSKPAFTPVFERSLSRRSYARVAYTPPKGRDIPGYGSNKPSAISNTGPTSVSIHKTLLEPYPTHATLPRNPLTSCLGAAFSPTNQGFSYNVNVRS